MKTLKTIFSVSTIVFAAAALVLFFTNVGKIVFTDGELIRTGTEFAFGASHESAEVGNSSDILFCLILAAFTVLFSALSFKFKGTRWATIGFSGVAAVYMLVVACSNPAYFLDTQGLSGVVSVAYVGNTPLFIAIALFATFGSAIAHLLIADAIAVAESKGQSLTIPKKVVKFLRDYKGEVKKIVWPGPRAVVKNTIIVLIMCLVLGAFVWLVDFGLGSLLDLFRK